MFVIPAGARSGTPFLGSESRRFHQNRAQRFLSNLRRMDLCAHDTAGVLVSLLLPAVQAAREAARRTSCQNNLKQIGIALQNYHDTFRVFPCAWIDTVPQGTNEREGWGWGALILPFIEQKPLHESLKVTKYNLWQAIINASPSGPMVDQDPNYRLYTETTLKVFMCPTDTGFNGSGQVHNNRNFNLGHGRTTAGWSTPVHPGMSNYVGVFGHRNMTNNQTGNSLFENNTGVMWRNSRVNSASIIDGLSNTAAVGERDSRHCRSGAWIGVQDSQGAGSKGAFEVGGYSRPKLNVPEQVFAWDNGQGCGRGFSSLHPNGAQFVFMDGSVHFLIDSINHSFPATSSNAMDANEDPVNGLYQRLLSANDELPNIGDW
jgi:prepilin-type processing-associated H-X9-DG protein